MLEASHRLESTWNICFVPYLDYLVLMAAGHILLPSSNVNSAQNLTRLRALDTGCRRRGTSYGTRLSSSSSSSSRLSKFLWTGAFRIINRRPRYNGEDASWLTQLPLQTTVPFLLSMLNWFASRVYLSKPRARHGFRETSSQLFIRSLSSL